jgi:hypothetical protein
MESIAREAGQIKIIIGPIWVNDEKLSPCLPFFVWVAYSVKKEWESNVRSPIILMALTFFG